MHNFCTKVLSPVASLKNILKNSSLQEKILTTHSLFLDPVSRSKKLKYWQCIAKLLDVSFLTLFDFFVAWPVLQDRFLVLPILFQFKRKVL